MRPGDTVQVLCGHSRWTAARARWRASTGAGTRGFTFVMLSLSSLGALFFRGGMVRKVVTTYSGDTFPTYTPNPVFQEAYASGAVEVEHWSILTFTQRLEAAARGLPAVVTGSLQGSSMASNDAFTVADTAFGPVGLLAPLVPDVTLVHGAVADRDGNVALSEPLLEGAWGAWAARRGVVATVERVVESLEGLGHRVKIPAHRVLAVVEAPFGAHPGGLYAPGLPVGSLRRGHPVLEPRHGPPHAGTSTPGPGTGCSSPPPTTGTSSGSGASASTGCRRAPTPGPGARTPRPIPSTRSTRWRPAGGSTPRPMGPESSRPSPAPSPPTPCWPGRGSPTWPRGWPWPGPGPGAARSGSRPSSGMWGYSPTPADPYIFNHRVFPGTPMLADASTVLGMVVGGPGTRTIACLGAAQVDRDGNLNSTLIPGGPFLVGSGGANDVASRAAACVVVALARPDRLVERVGFVTSPGDRVVSVVTDRGVLRRIDGTLQIAAVPGRARPGVRAGAGIGRCLWVGRRRGVVGE